MSLAIFDLQQFTLIPFPSFKSIGLSVQELKLNIDFQDEGFGGYLGFPIGTSLANFYLQIAPILPTKFQVNQPFCSKWIFKWATVVAILDFLSK